MAKKKTKKSNLGKILSFVAIVLGVVATAMIFVAAVKTPDVELLGKTVKGEGLSGLKVAFGYSEDKLVGLSFSIFALLPYVLALAGAVLTALNTFGKKNSKLFDFISIGAFVAAGIMFFLMPGFMVFADTLTGAALKLVEWELAVGSIVAGVSAVLAGAAVIVKTFKK
jgi:hypothetical protein